MTFDIGTSADVTSLDALIARMERLPEIVEKYADLMAAEMIRVAPYDDRPNRPAGLHLREDIIVHLNGLVAEIVAGANLPDARARFMEFGTARILPRYYFRTSVERYAMAFIIEVEKVLTGG